MDTLSSYTPQNKPTYYVYTLAYPNGDIFYVGKGTDHGVPEYYNRIDAHEQEAKAKEGRVCNPQKVATIRKIWETGEEVKKEIIARFDDESEAYLYECALINLTIYADKLTNIVTGLGTPHGTNKPEPKPKPPPKAKPLPPPPPPHKHEPGEHWGCFQSPKGVIYHEITNIHHFAKRHGVIPFSMINLAHGKRDEVRGWIRSPVCPPNQDF